MMTLMTKAQKEAHIAKHLSCPNCGSKKFEEVCSNAALTFRCDCGLVFNFMPELRIVDIVRDPL